MPPAWNRFIYNFAEHSLLTEGEIRAFFAQTRATKLTFLGLKIAARPADAGVAARLALLHSVLLVMASAALAARP
jgi:hypothetical protein